MTDFCALQRRPTDLCRALSLRALSPGMTELEARILASRGAGTDAINLPRLLATSMMDLPEGATRITQAIQYKQKIVVIADFDCDGATACTVAVAGLRALGADIGYVVPDRMIHGYGISPSVVDLARDRFKDVKVLLTVDNGVLGHEGITYAAQLGLDVVVTDHHLPGMSLPDAVAVIDPTRGDCPSNLPKLAGVGVALFLTSAVKKNLQQAGIETPSLGFLLPYVAIGTVADMVGLDAANRQLVTVGLELMRQGKVPPGVEALIRDAGLMHSFITTKDIGFHLGPRINAAGRLESMEAGIELLLATDPSKARKLARTLSATNEERKRLQKAATADATISLDFAFDPNTRAIVKGSVDWHPGIVGLVASRIKDNFHRPTFVFSLVDGKAKGSGRSIPGFQLKDALEEVARRHPNVLSKFGGHAMAAGASLTGPEALQEFADALDLVARQRITPEMLNQVLLSDGPMPTLNIESGAMLLRHPWGQHFDAPAFDDDVIVDKVTPMGKEGLHWSVEGRVGGRDSKTAIVLFNQPEPVIGQEVHMFLEPNLNTFRERTNLQWIGRVLS